MTNTNHQTEATRLIQQADESIMGLKKGCFIKYDEIEYEIISICGHEGEWGELLAVGQQSTDLLGDILTLNSERDDLSTLDILGRPIYPHDLMRAVEKVKPGYGYLLSFTGQIHVWDSECVMLNDVRCHYNLSAPWTEQSEALYEWVCGVLG